MENIDLQVDEQAILTEEDFDTTPPQTTSASSIITPEDISAPQDDTAQKPQNFGKFKDAESLLKAYTSLEAEFTKRSQKLSEFEKKFNCDNATSIKTEVSPQYLLDSWEAKLGQFLLNNPEAKNYASQISELIISDPKLAEADDALEKAWAKVCLATFKAPNEIVNDTQMLSQILSNEQVKEKVIEDYLLNVSRKKTVPLITKKVGTGLAVMQPPKPQSLEEAKELASKLFL